MKRVMSVMLVPGFCLGVAFLSSCVSQAADSGINDSRALVQRLQTNTLPYGFERKVLQPSPPVHDVQFEGSSVMLRDVVEKTPGILATASKERKKKWLLAIAPFSTDLQESVVPTLVTAFSREQDDEIKFALLYTVNWSHDLRMLDLCAAVDRRADPELLLLACNILISYGRIRGVELLTETMSEFPPEQQRKARICVSAARDIFQFDFKWDPSQIGPRTGSEGQARILTPQWTNWWNTNRQRYLPNP